MKACEAYVGNLNDFKLIKWLLEAGSNTNAVDHHRRVNSGSAVCDDSTRHPSLQTLPFDFFKVY
jgi:hypothetical protein